MELSLSLPQTFLTITRSPLLDSTDIKSTQSKLGIVMHIYYPNPQEAEARGLWAGQKAWEGKKAS
jgi:hypothetical protein